MFIVTTGSAGTPCKLGSRGHVPSAAATLTPLPRPLPSPLPPRQSTNPNSNPCDENKPYVGTFNVAWNTPDCNKTWMTTPTETDPGTAAGLEGGAPLM